MTGGSGKMQNHWTKMMSRRHGSVLNVHMPMIRWHTASSAVIVFKMKPMKMRWITISLVSGLSVIENIVTGQPRNPMIWHGYWNLCRRIT